MRMLKDTKKAFSQIPVERRVIYLGIPLALAFFLVIHSGLLLSNAWLGGWGLCLAASILAICFASACEVTFHQNYKVELDDITEREVRRYEGRNVIRRTLWRSRASRSELRGLLPDEILDSPLIPSIGVWNRVGKWGVFIFLLLPMFIFFVLGTLAKAS